MQSNRSINRLLQKLLLTIKILKICVVIDNFEILLQCPMWSYYTSLVGHR